MSTPVQEHAVHRAARKYHRSGIRVCAALLGLQSGSLPAQLALCGPYLASGDVDRAVEALTTYLPGGNPDSGTASSSTPARQAMAAQLTRKYARALEYLQDSVDAELAAGTRAADATLDQVVALAALHLQLGHLDQAEATVVGSYSGPGATSPER
ncbi:hypothetical protein GGF32_004460 [Allomyces javanicus]|nr:hypothetical protein GGF32_004460 [Allomyces javanicus]